MIAVAVLMAPLPIIFLLSPVQLVELAKHKSVSNKGIFFRALYLIHVGLSIDLRQINEHHNDCLLRLSRFGGWGNVEKEALVIVD